MGACCWVPGFVALVWTTPIAISAAMGLVHSRGCPLSPSCFILQFTAPLDQEHRDWDHGDIESQIQNVVECETQVMLIFVCFCWWICYGFEMSQFYSWWVRELGGGFSKGKKLKVKSKMRNKMVVNIYSKNYYQYTILVVFAFLTKQTLLGWL